MQKNIFFYIQYSFSRLFSQKFWNIVGSSIGISFIMTLLTSLFSIGSGYSIYTLLKENSMGVDSWIYILIAGMIGLLMILSLIILVRGWMSIVIPIRSIDPTKNLDFWSDYELFRTHIGTYFWYISWQSGASFLIIIGYCISVIVFSAIHTSLGWICGIGGIIGMLYLFTRMYITWYHMLSEGSGRFHTFKESIRLTRGKAWIIFWKVLGFSIIIGIISTFIESTLSGFMGAFGTNTILNEIALALKENTKDATVILSQVGKVLQENSGSLSIISVLFGIFYSVSSTLSRALYHIFYVRFYLDIREEHENENSFVKSILYSSPSQNP